ncbi:hypothetical protein LBMAG42_24040 [Deltaproteobacteria bacterium]|nr:hypothetical protein LBMAG42_24040 [Deltaproteobacteria bacterium]
MTLLLLFTACASCVGLPESVPSNPGTVDEPTAPDLLSAASPDLEVIPWAVIARLAAEDYRDCPLVYLTTQSLSIDAGGETGCLDSAGVRWQGSASVSLAAGGSVVLSFNDFGPVEGVPSPWLALGTLTITTTPGGSGQRVASRLEVTSHGPGDPLAFWNDTSGSFTFYDGVFYADHVYGTVGLGEWGTAEIDTNRLPLSLTNGCPFGMHASGTIALFASNTGVFSFSQSAGDAGLAGPPPPPPAPPPASGSADTGDSAGGGGGDGSGLVLPNPTGDAGDVCGACVNLTIEGTAVAGCVQPTRTISYPFYDPF